MQDLSFKTQLDLPIPATVPMSPTMDNAGEQFVTKTIPRSVEAPIAASRYCDVDTDQESATLWVHLKTDAPSIFTTELIDDLRTLHESVQSRLDFERGPGSNRQLRYQVLASRIPGVFSLGGDLALFRDCIDRGDVQTLRRYAQAAVSLVHASANAYDGELTTIALVQGQALGGGFETALAAHVLVAERSAVMAFPEVLFNLFPGMGAYQLLSRRMSHRDAEQMILSGRTYSALELHALGVVDVLAEDGEGERAVRRYIRTHDRQHHARRGLRRALQAASPLEPDSLRRIAEVWVDTALALAPRDLETIDYLLRAQRRNATVPKSAVTPVLRTA